MLSSNPRRRNIGGTSKCIEILRCDPRIQYKGFYRLTLPRQKQPSPSPSYSPVFTVSLSPPVASRTPSSKRPTRVFVSTRTQFTMELLRPFSIMRSIMHLCSPFDMHKASHILYTGRSETSLSPVRSYSFVILSFDFYLFICYFL